MLVSVFVINGNEYGFQSFAEKGMPTVMKVSLIRQSGVQPEVGTLRQRVPPTWDVTSASPEHQDAVKKIAAFLTDRRKTDDPKVLERKSGADDAPFVVTCSCGRKHEVRALPRFVCCDCGSWLRAQACAGASPSGPNRAPRRPVPRRQTRDAGVAPSRSRSRN